MYLGVCPVQFALYMKSKLYMKRRITVENIRTDFTSIHFKQHFVDCDCDAYVRNGSSALARFLYNFEQALIFIFKAIECFLRKENTQLY